MRVFISSTVFDLIDARAELADHLKSLGVVPVLSDDKLSDFRVQPEVSSIQTCLVNVESCDEVIVILDRRYGPTLNDYEGVSATHLEYRHAVRHRKPVHFYVRDRMAGEFAIWKRNKQNESIELVWVGQKDRKLFDLLEEHAKLQPGTNTSNWYSTFSSSVDLKAAVGKYFDTRLIQERLVAAVHSNEFPLLDLSVDVTVGHAHGRPAIVFSATLKNIGGAPAFHCRVFWDPPQTMRTERAILACNQSLKQTAIYPLEIGNSEAEIFLNAEYESVIGIQVIDRFKLSASLKGSGAIAGGNLADRQFRRSKGWKIEIDEQ